MSTCRSQNVLHNFFRKSVRLDGPCGVSSSQYRTIYDISESVVEWTNYELMQHSQHALIIVWPLRRSVYYLWRILQQTIRERMSAAAAAAVIRRWHWLTSRRHSIYWTCYWKKVGISLSETPVVSRRTTLKAHFVWHSAATTTTLDYTYALLLGCLQPISRLLPTSNETRGKNCQNLGIQQIWHSFTSYSQLWAEKN